MSTWVYPQANPSAHSGIMGFRNNTDADFYLYDDGSLEKQIIIE